MFKKIRKSLNYVKSMKELLKDGVEDDSRSFIFSSEITKEKYIIRKNREVLAKSNFIIAGVCITNIDGEDIPCIYHDNTFKVLSEETQQFIIQHELGHFYRHKDLLLGLVEPVRNDKIECEADEYAMCKVGQENAIKALNEIKELMDTLSRGRNKAGIKEVDRRIEYISSLM